MNAARKPNDATQTPPPRERRTESSAVYYRKPEERKIPIAVLVGLIVVLAAAFAVARALYHPLS